MKPSNFDMNISMLGRTMRKIFNAIPGRKPWINDLIAFLSTDKDLTSTSKRKRELRFEIVIYISMRGFKNGTAFSMPSMLASVCTNAIGIMKKNVRKKKATAITSLLMVRWT